jgi:hypothetical protein
LSQQWSKSRGRKRHRRRGYRFGRSHPDAELRRGSESNGQLGTIQPKDQVAEVQPDHQIVTVRARQYVTDALTGRIWWVFSCWAGLWAAAQVLRGAGVSWHYFVAGSRLLTSSQGLHLYATHSELQIGPATLLVTAPAVLFLPAWLGKLLMMIVMSAAGLFVLAELRRLIAFRTPVSDRTVLAVGLVFLAVWSDLAVRYAHPDDVLAIALTVMATRLLRMRHNVLGAVALALAADCKPWAVAFLPLLMIVESSERRRVVMVWLATLAVAWLPFLTDPRTLSAGTYRIANALDSSLRVLGEHSASTPMWVRPAQLLVGAALGFIVIRRGRWSAVLAVAVAVRLLLDPGTWAYYNAGLFAGTAMCDFALLAVPVSWFTMSAAVFFYLPSVVLRSSPHLLGLTRTGYLVVLLAVIILVPKRVLRRVDRLRRERPMAVMGAPLH